MLNVLTSPIKSVFQRGLESPPARVAIMTPGLIRPVLVSALALAAAACGAVDSDPHRFERWGEAVASIPVSTTPAPSAAERNLRPALQVQVMDPHDLWDARDGRLRGVIDAAAPAVAEAVVTAARDQITPRPRPSLRQGMTIQIGAYGSEQAALAAWDAATARAPAAFSGLDPQLEEVTVSGRQLVRLKAGPVPAADAPAVCRAAGVVDQWCASTGRS